MIILYELLELIIHLINYAKRIECLQNVSLLILNWELRCRWKWERHRLIRT